MQVARVKELQAIISNKIDPVNFKAWIAPLNFEIKDSSLEITAHNQFTSDYIKNNFFNTLNDVAKQFNLNIKINNGNKIYPANNNEKQVFIPKLENNNIKNNFDSFVLSDDNIFVVSACKKIAEGAVNFSPLFIYGQSGVGKTLLCNCIKDSSLHKTIIMTGNQFSCEFQRALTEKSIFAFKDYCRNCDIFILDGIQEISGKKATTEEFCQLVLDLISMKKNIVITSLTSPSNLDGFDRRIQSLFASGLTADITPMSEHTKKIIFQREGIDSELSKMLSERVNSNGHLIAGIIHKIKTYSEIMSEKVTPKIAEKILSDSLKQSKTPVSLIKIMCEKLGATYEEVCSQRRNKTIARIRQIIMKVLKETTKLSLSEIGRLIGNRDHATVLYSISKIEQERDLILIAEITDLIKLCKE